jgi:peptide deformylase|tara:strand:+ start:3805 stop:4416 length:612 start_codon:yes stop_codon:yes gene_type:complete
MKFDIREMLVVDNITKVKWTEKRKLHKALRTWWDEHNLSSCAYALAAPQIGIPKTVFYVNNESVSITNQTYTNPSIQLVGDMYLFKGEGCLSFPGTYKDKWRSTEVLIQCDEFKDSQLYTGKAAVIMQHEMDHLRGITINQATTIVNNDDRPGRNDACYCGSGLKYKRCCLAYASPVLLQAFHKTSRWYHQYRTQKKGDNNDN